jgi:CHAT domain/Tetratricopeptide repeat
MARERINRSIVLLGLTGSILWMPQTSESQPISPTLIIAQSNELASNELVESLRLSLQVIQLKQQGKYREAIPLAERALAIVEKEAGPGKPIVATSLDTLAVLSKDQGDIIRSLEFLKRGTDIEEHNLALMLAVGSERRKRAYMKTLSGTTNATLSLHLQSAPDNPQATRLAFSTLLSRKGRILDALTQNQQTLRQNLTPEDQKSFDELAATQTQLANLTFNPSPKLPPEQYRKQLDTLTSKAEQLEDTLSRRSAEFRSESQPVTLEAVQKLIPKDAALVELVQYRPLNLKATKQIERFGKPRYAAYILFSQGEPRWTDLGDAEPINQDLEEFRPNLQAFQVSIPQLKRTSRNLDAKLMQPIRKLLGNTRNILLSPDGALNLIPFEALVDENNQYLVENYHFTYLTSGRDLLRLQHSSPSQQPNLVMADPSFNQPGKTIALQTNTRTISLSDKIFAPLPGTAEEAKAIAPWS